MTFENNDINYPLEIKTIRSYFNKETSLEKYIEMVIYDFQLMRIRAWDKSYVRNFIINKENYNTLFKNFIKEFCL